MKAWLSFICVLLTFFQVTAFALTSEEQNKLKDRVEAVMVELDQPRLFRTESFILSMYQQVLNSIPSDMELFTMQLLLDGIGTEAPIERSHFVEQLLVVRSEQDELTWEFLSDNIELIEALDPALPPINGVYAFRQDEVETSSEKRYLEPMRNDGNYRVFHGFLHAHSELSDGRGDAVSAYRMARFEAGLDYFALTDHSEFLHFWPWDKKYEQLKRVSNRFNKDGEFAALYGFEWSHPVLGHFNVVNTEKYTSAIVRPTMGLLMRWLSRKSRAFGRFNHPGRHNMKYWPYEFRRLKVYNDALFNVVGIEMWNKNNGLKHYLYEQQSFMERFNFLDNANLNGWFVGAVGGQDNHGADWGLRNDYRVGVWSRGLSREKIVESYFARRTFATEDKNAWISFKINGAQMGSRLKPGRLKMKIEFGDPNGERVVKAQLIRNGRELKQFVLATAKKRQQVEFAFGGTVGQYYYVIAEQEDGDLLMSSPIWVVP